MSGPKETTREELTVEGCDNNGDHQAVLSPLVSKIQLDPNVVMTSGRCDRCGKFVTVRRSAQDSSIRALTSTRCP